MAIMFITVHRTMHGMMILQKILKYTTYRQRRQVIQLHLMLVTFSRLISWQTTVILNPVT